MLHGDLATWRAGLSSRTHRLFDGESGRDRTLSRKKSADLTEFLDDDFTYDYHLVRRGGLIFAAAAFILGIVIIFSNKLSCGGKRQAK
ncbi:hypothetical protein AAFF_G00277760 [Aldrovandia affinis]|uniref:FXYD domain-containing ion transport regulator n=1 Tax=Aldrovandia affinis TaxID=143900 RepID=A0AAD7W1S1_9TELE|nr:hypothetical protein AAFF_G00277760 [Aldrovandia affinis]